CGFIRKAERVGGINERSSENLKKNQVFRRPFYAVAILLPFHFRPIPDRTDCSIRLMRSASIHDKADKRGRLKLKIRFQ
ncbi:hypothetical protein, partial [Neisseria sp. P0015.S002]|uniref:hypothetical protein n=1 Tax=Neisseria sp. P0015.S002 TaxID=3436758 RepID=UPI003F80F1D7